MTLSTPGHSPDGAAHVSAAAGEGEGAAGETPEAAGRLARPKMHGWLRSFERHLLPQFVSTVWILLRDRTLVSLSSRVQLSSRVRFGAGSAVKPFSIVQTSGGRVVFGRQCRISSFNHIGAGGADIIAGDHVRTGPHVAIIASSRQYRRRDQLVAEQGFRDRGVTIGNDVFIGAHSTILDGARIGDGVVVGAGSVVTGTVEPYTVVMGAPARPVGART